MDHDNFVVITTLDKAVDIKVSCYPTYYRLMIKPHGTPSNLSNTRHYAYSDEAIEALRRAGYEYAEELITDAMDQLEFKSAED